MRIYRQELALRPSMWKGDKRQDNLPCADQRAAKSNNGNKFEISLFPRVSHFIR